MADETERDPHIIDLPGGGWAHLFFGGELSMRTTRRLHGLRQQSILHTAELQKRHGYDPTSADPYEWVKGIEVEDPEAETPDHTFGYHLICEFLVAWEYPYKGELVTKLPTPDHKVFLDLPTGPYMAVLREASKRFSAPTVVKFGPDGAADPKADESSSIESESSEVEDSSRTDTT